MAKMETGTAREAITMRTTKQYIEQQEKSDNQLVMNGNGGNDDKDNSEAAPSSSNADSDCNSDSDPKATPAMMAAAKPCSQCW